MTRTLERFFELAMPEPNSGCWLWTGPVNASGYGVLNCEGARFLAHRFSCQHFNGSLLPGQLACHRCDVRCCVNPAHIYAGSPMDNSRDAVSRGRLHKWGGMRRGDGNPRVKIPDDEIPKILAAKRAGRAIRALAREYSVDRNTMRDIVRGTRLPVVAKSMTPRGS